MDRIVVPRNIGLQQYKTDQLLVEDNIRLVRNFHYTTVNNDKPVRLESDQATHESLTCYNREQLSLLVITALNGYDDVVRVLLTHCNSKLQIELKGRVILYDTKRMKNITVLHCACYRGHFTMTKTLIELGQANVQHGIRDYPLLIFMLQLLLTCGCEWLDSDAIESPVHDTPLRIICKRNRNPQIIKLLLNSGCHIDSVNKDGQIPFEYVNDKEIQALFPTKLISVPLKCLCARIIAQNHLNTIYLSLFPSTLKKFVFLHHNLHT
ncbi:unnamed protein product [Adineta ricciae]|uniref:Uncharacterized protein n=1 Tax=Adineta ricciae TaxID=249248 RepID=A0A815AF33_ADIRI|nr:unnamed protein product [Adineta ricciae]